MNVTVMGMGMVKEVRDEQFVRIDVGWDGER